MLSFEELERRYKKYTDKFELDQDRGRIHEDEEPITYEEFIDAYLGYEDV